MNLRGRLWFWAGRAALPPSACGPTPRDISDRKGRGLVRSVVLALGLLVAPGLRADTAVTVAQGALVELEGAAEQLAEARGARDRVAALTRVIGAYETGLAALREGLRQAAIREAVLRQYLDRESARVAQLLGALESLETTPETLLMLHPMGPLGAVRSGMLLAGATPALQLRVADLRQRLDEIRLIRALQESALEGLEQGLRGVQEARTELSLAISNRTDLPRRFADDREAIARLLENTDTLAAFAEGLVGIEAMSPAEAGLAPSLPLPLPVTGRVIRGYGEKDAAGIRRPGLLIATAPQALVTTPVAATIRYLGPLLDYGNVMILEPEPGRLLVLAGLDRVYGDTGQVIPAGTPVGLMGGAAPTGTEFVAQSVEGGGSALSETLYLELRQGNDPVDPAVLFAGTKDAAE